MRRNAVLILPFEGYPLPRFHFVTVTIIYYAGRHAQQSVHDAFRRYTQHCPGEAC